MRTLSHQHAASITTKASVKPVTISLRQRGDTAAAATGFAISASGRIGKVNDFGTRRLVYHFLASPSPPEESTYAKERKNKAGETEDRCRKSERIAKTFIFWIPSAPHSDRKHGAERIGTKSHK